MDWPESTMIKDLQQFLGLANFHQQFIQNYSSIANLLTSLLWGKPKGLHWTDQARVAFAYLKRSCTTAAKPHLDPILPFTVEVDTSSCGIGAVPRGPWESISMSQKLTPEEANYDVGNRELLSIKEKLEK